MSQSKHSVLFALIIATFQATARVRYTQFCSIPYVLSFDSTVVAASSRLLLRSHEAVSLQENASVLLQGSIHQRDGIFSPDSRGRQCLPCCLVLLVKAVQKRICTNKLNVNNMNEILFAGDKLYKYAKKNAKTYHDYLEPCDLPSYFSLDNQHYPWKVKKEKKKNVFRKFKYLILSGVSFPWFRDRTRYDFLIQPICSLHLQRLFYCIIGTRWLFLPFWVTCKTLDGMPNVNGKNILLKKTNITGIFLTFA